MTDLPIVERLRRTKTQVRVNPIFGGAVAYSDGETREASINPDGADAAELIEELYGALNEAARLSLDELFEWQRTKARTILAKARGDQ